MDIQTQINAGSHVRGRQKDTSMNRQVDALIHTHVDRSVNGYTDTLIHIEQEREKERKKER